MNEQGAGEGLPLVAVISNVPMLAEAISDALDEVADVRRFPAGRGDTPGLLRGLRPDGVVVDTDEEAVDTAEFARETGTRAVLISLRDGSVRILGDATDEPELGACTSVEVIRNVLIAGLFRRVRTEVMT